MVRHFPTPDVRAAGTIPATRHLALGATKYPSAGRDVTKSPRDRLTSESIDLISNIEEDL